MSTVGDEFPEEFEQRCVCVVSLLWASRALREIWATMKQATLISLYGEKRGDFTALIKRCQESVGGVPGVAFTPYDPVQIHGTIFGLERKLGSPGCNANFAKHRSRDVIMDLDGILDYLRACGRFPLEIQIGGYGNREYPFTSRDSTPYERSFSIQADKVVMMGWPVRGNPFGLPPATPCAWVQEASLYPRTLDLIRHAAQGFGILHSYHRRLNDVDNDLFFRIGLVDPKSLTKRTLAVLEAKVRKLLSEQPPLLLEIRLEDVFVAAYEDDTLPPSSTQVWSLTDPRLGQDSIMGALEL